MRRCPNGHCFDDDELICCPECGLPMKDYATQTEEQMETIQREESDNQSSDPCATEVDKAPSKALALWIFGILFAFVAFVILEITDTTFFVPSWHKQSAHTQESISVEIDVSQYDMDSFQELSSWKQTLKVGENEVWTREAPEGYRLVNPEYYIVTVDAEGNPSSPNVNFAYVRVEQDSIQSESPMTEEYETPVAANSQTDSDLRHGIIKLALLQS